MPTSLRIEGLLVKEEATYGTDPTPTAGSDGVRGVGRIWSGLSHEFVFANQREEAVSNSLIQVAPGIPAGRVMNIDYRVQLMGAGAAYAESPAVRPECDALLMACGMSRTHVNTSGSESVTYALADTGHSSCTVWAYAGGQVFKVVGCRGTWTWSPSAGGLGEIRFQLQGMLTTTPATASVPSITYDSVIPPPAIAMSPAIVPSGGSSWTPAAASFEVEAGCQVQRLDDVAGSDGLEGFFIDMQAPRFRFTPRTVALSDYNPYSLAENRTVQTIDLTLGSTQYNRVDLDVNLAYLMNDPGTAEDNGFTAWQAEYMLRDLALAFN